MPSTRVDQSPVGILKSGWTMLIAPKWCILVWTQNRLLGTKEPISTSVGECDREKLGSDLYAKPRGSYKDFTRQREEIGADTL